MNGDYDLQALADVYITSRAGTYGAAKVLWRMSVEDAQKVCSDPSTRHTDWMMCWTYHQLVPAEAWAFKPDDGRFAELFERLGVTVVMSRQMLLNGTARLLQPAPVGRSDQPRQLDIFGNQEAA